MQQQIMMLESTIAGLINILSSNVFTLTEPNLSCLGYPDPAYTLSALSLHNARSSERQMMASSWLIMTAAVSFSYGDLK